jgi:hypothetical protein
MSHPKKQPPRKLHSQPGDIHELLNALLALDRTVVEVSMNLYKIPRRDRAAMREQQRWLHDAVRQRLPRLVG